jgi:hypothetical protein
MASARRVAKEWDRGENSAIKNAEKINDAKRERGNR